MGGEEAAWLWLMRAAAMADGAACLGREARVDADGVMADGVMADGAACLRREARADADAAMTDGAQRLRRDARLADQPH